MSQTKLKMIFGTAAIASFDPKTIDELLRILEQHQVKDLDTARIYTNSEVTLGKHNAPSKFTIHTKAPGWAPGSLSKQSVLDGMAKSLKELKNGNVETFFLHAPDPTVPITETLSGINELYADGKFSRFGLSNFSAAQVQEIYTLQQSTNSVLPTVFQGNYNAVSRHIEDDLFPLLRKLNISFYAYSPIAGGFLVKDSAALGSRNLKGRFGPGTFLGDMYSSMYGKESLILAVDEWEKIATDGKVSKAALAYRWITHHSTLDAKSGDGVIIGASSTAQLEETLMAIDAGPLGEDIASRVNDIWKTVQHEAPIDNYHSYAALD